MKNYGREVNFFRKVMKIRRIELGYSQETMAEFVECHTNALGRIERGQALPTLVTIIKIARALKISPKDLMLD